MIDKKTILVTSGGRTGTLFFANLLKKIIPDSITFHEAESIGSVDSMPMNLIFKKFGFFNSTVKKMLGKWGVTSISNRRIGEKLSKNDAAQLLNSERKSFIDSFEEELFIESSYHYYGLIDIIPLVFKNCRMIYITRDGRDWVRSWMNTKGFYNRTSFHTIFNLRLRPQPSDGQFFLNWNNMSRFEKLCWAWAKINEYAFHSVKMNSKARFVYFEDIFKAENKQENLKSIIRFITTFNSYVVKTKPLEGFVENKINLSLKNDFPHFKEWTRSQKESFLYICNDTMKTLGYEARW